MTDIRTEWWRPVRVAEAASVPTAGARVAATAPKLAFLGLLAFTFVLLIAPQSHFPWLAKLQPAAIAGGLAILAWSLDRFARRLPVFQGGSALKLAAAMGGLAVLTIPFSLWPGGSATFLKEIVVKSLVIFWLISVAVDSPRRLYVFVWTLTLLTLPLAATAVTHFHANAFVEGEAVRRIVGYDAPLSGNPNDLALMLNLVLPLTVALRAGERRRFRRMVLLGAIGLSVFAIICTFSRAGFLTLAVLVVLAMRELIRAGRPIAAGAIVAACLLTLPLLPADYRRRVSTITDVDADPTGSSQARWGDSLTAARRVMTHPVIGAGVGMGALALNAERGPTWREVHNVYLQTAVDLGLLGVGLFVALLIVCLRDTRRAERAGAAALQLVYLARGVRGSLIAFAVAACFHPIAYQFPLYYIAGLAVATRSVAEMIGMPTRVSIGEVAVESIHA